MKNIIKTKWFTFGTYLLITLVILLISFIFVQNNKTLNNVITSFFEVAENRSFDYRQLIKVAHKNPTPSKDIVVLAIDDISLESLWEKYGEWPLPRNIYADVINHIEKSKPKAVIFDLMFIKSIKSQLAEDTALIETMNKYDNIYTAMNFDNQPTNLRKAIDLPERLKLNIDNQSDLSFEQKYNFINCRPILSELLNGEVNVGMTNVMRSSDGIIRKVAPIMQYKGDFYPYLSFQAGSNYILGENTKDYVITPQKKLVTDKFTIPLTDDNDAILNWYGQSGTHTVYPMYKIINEINKSKSKSKYSTYDFKDKIVLIGTTAMSLHDTKSVPVQEGVYPGVEVHATFINNMIDNNFVQQSSFAVNFLISVSLIIIIGLVVMLSESTIFALLSTILTTIGYLFISYYALELYNLWIPIVIPVISIVISFALSFIVKYIIKSRDFDYQYKLATIDGLTELYNHRYFQDSLKTTIEVAKRYNQTFSLIILDIDYFKKFNDLYGHQSGDAVLRQVAQTLKKNSRGTDIICRYGGEEISIILPNTNTRNAMANAEKIRKAIEEKEFILNGGKTSNVTISLGVATYPDNADNPKDLIEFADKGLYYAKEHGRNQVGKIDN